MDVRTYDPTIARFNGIDPVTHFSQGTSVAFDNNPVFWADPSGADSWKYIGDGNYRSDQTGEVTDDWERAINETQDYLGETSSANNSSGSASSGGTNPQEGQSRDQTSYNSYVGEYKTGAKEYYHGGGVKEGKNAGWYSESEYLEIYRTVIRDIGLGKGTIESLNDYGFTEGVYNAMADWALQAIDYYSEHHDPRIIGNINTDDFNSPVFLLSGVLAGRFLNSSKLIDKSINLVKIGEISDDVIVFSSKFGDEAVEGIANFKMVGDKLHLNGLHLQGSSAGQVGRSNMWNMAKDLGKQFNAKEVIIQGGKRTTGKYKGTVPSPITIKVN